MRKLGVHVSRQIVKNILVEVGVAPDPASGEDSWDSFLKRHAATLWQCDFLTKAMWTPLGRVDLFLLVFLHLGTRRCWISPCTRHPDAAWVTQQARHFLMDAEEWELSPTIVMRDNDGKFQGGFDAVIESSGATIHRIVPTAPNLRAHVERFIQSFGSSASTNS